MAECQDRRLERLLAAYELGFLADEERLEVEAHLIECDACYKRARDFSANRGGSRNSHSRPDTETLGIQNRIGA
jgi:anti-sigma factor RsiW